VNYFLDEDLNYRPALETAQTLTPYPTRPDHFHTTIVSPRVLQVRAPRPTNGPANRPLDRPRPRVRQVARRHFNCPSIPGVPLEDEGGPGSKVCRAHHTPHTVPRHFPVLTPEPTRPGLALGDPRLLHLRHEGRVLHRHAGQRVGLHTPCLQPRY
jgi:hypothetical protein